MKKLVYAIMLVLMIFVSACAQQQEQPSAQPAAASNPAPIVQEPAPEPETGGTGASVAPQAEEKAPEAKSDEARLLGTGKYEPLEVKISKGGTVTFFNDGGIKTVITIKGKGKIINTQVIQPGGKYEQEFMEAGTYEYWGVAYGQGGAKIIVE